MTDLGDFTDIIIDKREPEGMEELFLELEYGVIWIQDDTDDTESFDYRQGNVVVERKTVNDFIQSFKSDHIYDQLERMCNKYEHFYLIIEGDIFEANYRDTSSTTDQVLGAMADIAVRYGVHPMWVQNMNHFAYTVGKIFQSHRDGKVGMSRRTKLTSARKNDTMAAKIISLVDGLDKVAEDIAEKFELVDIMDVIELTFVDLITVPKVGPKKANKILNDLGIPKDK